MAPSGLRAPVFWNLKPLRQILRPLCADSVVERLARTGDGREGFFAPPWDAGVDDHPRIAPVGLGVVAHRVERRAPSAVDDIDLIARIAARAHRPDNVGKVGSMSSSTTMVQRLL